MKKIDFSYPALIIALICTLIAALMVFGSSLGLWEPIVGFGARRNYNNLLGYISVVAGAFAIGSGQAVATERAARVAAGAVPVASRVANRSWHNCYGRWPPVAS